MTAETDQHLCTSVARCSNLEHNKMLSHVMSAASAGRLVLYKIKCTYLYVVFMKIKDGSILKIDYISFSLIIIIFLYICSKPFTWKFVSANFFVIQCVSIHIKKLLHSMLLESTCLL